MTRRALILAVSISIFFIISTQHLLAMSLEEAMLRLQVEVLQAQMGEFLAQNDVQKAKKILSKMTKLDEEIRSFSVDEVEVYIDISEQPKPDEGQTEPIEQVQPEEPVVKTRPDNVMETYEKVVVDTCKRMDFDPAVIWTLLAIESNFSKDPVVIQKRTKCLGPWQHQPEHYLHYRKMDGTPYNPFDIHDACEVTVRIMQDNLAVTGSMGKAIRMYCSGSRYLDTPYEKLPKSVKSYLDKYRRLYPAAEMQFTKHSKDTRQGRNNERIQRTFRHRRQDGCHEIALSGAL